MGSHISSDWFAIIDRKRCTFIVENNCKVEHSKSITKVFERNKRCAIESLLHLQSRRQERLQNEIVQSHRFAPIVSIESVF